MGRDFAPILESGGPAPSECEGRSRACSRCRCGGGRAAFSQGGQGIFRPHYVPRMVRMRDQKPPRAADLEGLLRGVEAKELALKHIERKVRKESDYRNVIRFLADTTSVYMNLSATRATT